MAHNFRGDAMTRPFASEDAFLAAIHDRFANVHPHMILGRGDDCAILRFPPRAVLTTDLFIEDVHFRRDYFRPEDAGYKALAVNVSDIAAMGARPLGFCLGLSGPPSTPAGYWVRVMEGMAGLADSLNLPLVGGDLNAGEKIALAVTVWGEPGPSGRFLRRGTCRTGDVLFLVGPVGLARTGLDVLEALGPAAKTAWPKSSAAHLRPTIRVAAGLALAGIEAVSGLMDVSDGLARDVPRFLAPGQGADLRLSPRDMDPEVLRRCDELGQDPALTAVLGGEDYALLGSCPPEALDAVQAALPEARRVGAVTAEPGVFLNGSPLNAAGFDHFQG